MKEIETTNRKVLQKLSTIEKQNSEIRNTESKGTVYIEEQYGMIKFERNIKHSKERIWETITDKNEVFKWLPNYEGTFNGYKDGTIELINTVSGSRVTGKVLVYERYSVFEYEWFIAPNQMFPNGEPKSVIRWEIKQNDDLDSILIVTHSYLTKSTALAFAPGWHAYLDRLEAVLANRLPPDWVKRSTEVKKLYST